MPSRNIKDAIPELQKAWPKILDAFEKSSPSYTLHLTCTHRTPEEQWELYKKGRTNVGTYDTPVWVPKEDWVGDQAPEEIVTYCDGDKKLSPHNYYPARAIDVVVFDPSLKRERWEPYLYQPMLDICKKLKLVSGGAWTAFKDWPHVEWPLYKTYKPT